MISLLLALTVAQTPPAPVDRTPVVVVVASKRAGADDFARRLTDQVHDEIVKAGVDGALDDKAATKLIKKAKVDVRSCQGATSCLSKVAFALGPRAVVIGVDVGKVAGTLAVHLEAVAADVMGPLANVDFTVPTDDFRAQAMPNIVDFAKTVVAKSRPGATPAIPDVANEDALKTNPTSVEPPPPGPLEPQQPIAPAYAEVTENRSKVRRVVPWITTVAAVGVLALSGTFAVMGNTDKSLAESTLRTQMDGSVVSTLPRNDFDALAGRANSRFTVALISGLVGAALVALSVVLFATGS